MHHFTSLLFYQCIRFKEEQQETRVIIFSQFRDCVTELAAVLGNLRPLVRPMAFVGEGALVNHITIITPFHHFTIISPFHHTPQGRLARRGRRA